MKQDKRLPLCTVADVDQVTFHSEHNRYKQLIIETSAVRELKHATFLSHGRQPEVNISHARTVVSLRFSK